MIINSNWLQLGVFGALGALTKDVIIDNKVKLPKCADGMLYLGCIGGMIIGAMAGYIVDNDPVTAFLGGYAGKQLIEGFVKMNGDKK